MPRITKRVVDATRPDAASRRVYVWDSDVKGFGLMVTANGTKSYVLQYRTAHGRSRRYTIGKHGSPWTAEEAREKATDLLREMARGHDPLEAKAEAKAAMTIRELADLYLKEGPAEKPNKRESSWEADRSNIRRHIKPLLGNRVALTLTQADIAKFQRDVAAGKTAVDEKTKARGRARVRGGKSIAARSLAVLGAMLQFAVGRGIVPTNPAKGVELFKTEGRERFLSEDEVARLADTLREMEAEGKIGATMAAAIRLLVLTGARKTEVLGLRWSDVDFERGVIVLAEDRSKSGTQTGVKRIPLPAPAQEIITGLPRADDAVYVLPAARGDGHVVGLQKAWEAVRTRAKLPGVRIHDMRHSFVSFAAADGASLYLIGKVVGHTQARTTEKYAHLAADPLKAISDRTAARIAAAMKGAKGGTEVVPIEKHKRNRL